MHPTFHRKDTFLTFGYRSAFIHTCRNLTLGKDEIAVTLPDGSRKPAQSVRSARKLIDRHLGGPPYWRNPRWRRSHRSA